MRNLLAGRRGDDHGPSLVCERRPTYGSAPLRRRGRKFTHYLQTNLIGYSEAWNEVIRTMFQGSLGTSMDYPNRHRKLFKGGAEAYTRLWTRKLKEAQAADIEVGVIAVLHEGSLEAGPERFYRYFTEELGLEQLPGEYPISGRSCSGSRGRVSARYKGVGRLSLGPLRYLDGARIRLRSVARAIRRVD